MKKVETRTLVPDYEKKFKEGQWSRKWKKMGVPSHWVPNWPVVKEGSVTTETRLVLDAHSRGKNSTSLTDSKSLLFSIFKV